MSFVFEASCFLFFAIHTTHQCVWPASGQQGSPCSLIHVLRTEYRKYTFGCLMGRFLAEKGGLLVLFWPPGARRSGRADLRRSWDMATWLLPCKYGCMYMIEFFMQGARVPLLYVHTDGRSLPASTSKARVLHTKNLRAVFWVHFFPSLGQSLPCLAKTVAPSPSIPLWPCNRHTVSQYIEYQTKNGSTMPFYSRYRSTPASWALQSIDGTVCIQLLLGRHAGIRLLTHSGFDPLPSYTLSLTFLPL